MVPLGPAESIAGGRPRDRGLYSSPRVRAVAAVHSADPNGRSRRTHSRTRSTSASVIARLTPSTHALPRGAVPGSSRTGAWSGNANHRRLDHGHASARSTRPARNGLRSMYRRTVSRCSSSSIGNALDVVGVSRRTGAGGARHRLTKTERDTLKHRVAEIIHPSAGISNLPSSWASSCRDYPSFRGN